MPFCEFQRQISRTGGTSTRNGTRDRRGRWFPGSHIGGGKRQLAKDFRTISSRRKADFEI